VAGVVVVVVATFAQVLVVLRIRVVRVVRVEFPSLVLGAGETTPKGQFGPAANDGVRSAMPLPAPELIPDQWEGEAQIEFGGSTRRRRGRGGEDAYGGGEEDLEGGEENLELFCSLRAFSTGERRR